MYLLKRSKLVAECTVALSSLKSSKLLLSTSINRLAHVKAFISQKSGLIHATSPRLAIRRQFSPKPAGAGPLVRLCTTAAIVHCITLANIKHVCVQARDGGQSQSRLMTHLHVQVMKLHTQADIAPVQMAALAPENVPRN